MSNPDLPCDHAKAIDELFNHRLSAAEQQQLYRDIRQCPSCRRLFDRYAEIEAAMGDRPVIGMRAEARSRVAERLLAPPPRKARWWMPAIAAAALAAPAAILLFPGSSGDFQARSRTGLPVDARVALRVLQVTRRASGRIAVEEITSGKLVAGSRVKLLYSNLRDYDYVSVAAYTSDGRPHWLYVNRLIEPGAENASIGPSKTVDAGWPAGPVRWIAWFTVGRLDPLPAAAPRASDKPGISVRIVDARLIREDGHDG